MSRLIQAGLLILAGVTVLAAASPALTRLAGAMVTPIVACGLVAALLRWVWWLTGPR